MTLETQMTLALLQELLMALRANDADGYKSWLALGIEELARDILKTTQTVVKCSTAASMISSTSNSGEGNGIQFDVIKFFLVIHCFQEVSDLLA